MALSSYQFEGQVEGKAPLGQTAGYSSTRKRFFSAGVGGLLQHAILVSEDPVAGLDFVLVGKAREPLSLEHHQHLRGLGHTNALDELMGRVNAEAVEVGERLDPPDAKSGPAPGAVHPRRVPCWWRP